MENLIQLVNRLQRAWTALGDHGEESALPMLWDALPSIAVVGGQSSGKSSVLESIVGKDFLPRGSGIVTRRPLVLQLHRLDEGREYAEFGHLPRKKFTDFAAVRKEIADETDRETGRSKQISSVPIYLSIYSPNVVNLTLIDLPGLTKVAVEGQSDSIVTDIENMVRSYIEKPNCIILAVSPANQDIATSDAIKVSREVDPKGERTFGVLTKIDLMDKGTDAVEMLEGRAYKLQFPWIGVVNRSQQDINKNVDMIAARRREREYFSQTPEYRHLAPRMGSEHLGKILSKHLESVIKSRIPGLQSLINKTIIELESELNRLGKPIATDAGGKLYMIMEICRAFDGIFKEHLDGVRPGGDKIYNVFDNQLPAALKRLQFDKHLAMENVRKLITEADGYQPHLIAPEQGYRRLIETALITIKGPAEAAVDALKSLEVEGAILDYNSSKVLCNMDLSSFLPLPYGTLSNMACKPLWNSYVLRYSQSKNNVITIVLSSIYTSGWVGMGFSRDGMMLNASCMVGWITAEGEGRIRQYHVKGFTPSEIKPDEGELPLTGVPPYIALNGATIYLAFQFKYNKTLKAQPVLLAFSTKYPHHLHLPMHEDKMTISFDFSSGDSDSIVDVSSSFIKDKRTHGILSLMGWGLLLPLGAIFARYLKHKDPLWYYLHVVIQFGGFLFGVAALVLGLSLDRNLHASIPTHKGIGIFVFVLTILQVLAFFSRPSTDSKYRRYWNWYHNWLGIICLFFGAVNVVVGIHLAGAGGAWKIGYGLLLGAVLVTCIVLETLLRLKWAEERSIPPAFSTNSLQPNGISCSI